MAWRAGQWEKAAAYLDQAGDDIDPSAFTRVGGDYQRDGSQILLRARRWQPQITHAAAAVADGRYDEAVATYRSLLEQTDEQPLLDEHLRGLKRIAEVQQAFEAGDWIDIQPTTTLSAWQVRQGRWDVLDDSALDGRSNKAGMSLVLDVPLEPRLEMTGEIEFVADPFQPFNAGVYVRYEGHSPERWHALTIYKKLRKAVVRRFAGEQVEEINEIKRVVGPRQRFHIQQWDQSFWTQINDEPVHEEVLIDAVPSRGRVRVGVGGYFWYEGAHLRFRDLRLRRLTEQPSGEAGGEAQ